MKGLLVKDFRIAFAQKKLWIVMAILGLIMAFFLQDSSMATLYVMLIVICIAATTIVIDQQGMQFILTLPISRKEYVIEKYLFAYIFGFSALIIGGGILLLISLFAPGITVNDSLENIALIAVVCVLLPSIEIPASIIFGAEKGKLGYYILVGIIMAIYGIGNYIANFVMMSNVRESLATKVMAMPKGALAGIGIVLLLALGVISFMISFFAINKKEY